MAQKQFLHELLKEDQEPFRLKNYIADRRNQFKKTSPATDLHLRRRKPNVVHETSRNRGNILCKHACFLSFQNSPDVKKSPFFEFPSPAKSPRKSPNGAVFLHIPSRTAALLVEAAMRIHKQQQARPEDKSHCAKNVGLGLLGSFFRRLKERSKIKRRSIEDFRVENATLLGKQDNGEIIRIPCSCSNRRLSSSNWTENNEDKSVDFETSTSGCGSECSGEIHVFASTETRFCPSPFRFNLHKSSSFSGHRTPEFVSPSASPSRRVNQEKENYESRVSNNVREDEEDEEDKEQCSPVSVLDTLYEGNGQESGDTDEDDYDIQCIYQNVQRAKHQLLYRLRRFEKLAELDTVELERNLLELSGDDEREKSDGDEQSSLYRKQGVETILTQVFNQSSLRYHSANVSSDMKRLVSDLIVEEEGDQVVQTDANEVVTGRVCSRLNSWREVEPNTIDMMIGFDFKSESGRWTRFDNQVEEISNEIEVGICGLLVEELSDELLNMAAQSLGILN